MIIREAQEQDIPAVYILWCELMQHHQVYHPVFQYHPSAEASLKQTLLKRFASEDTTIFIAQKSDTLVGFLIANFKTSPEGFHYRNKGYIAETYVREDARGSGVGKKLFDAARRWFTAQQADHIELQVAIQN